MRHYNRKIKLSKISAAIALLYALPAIFQTLEAAPNSYRNIDSSPATSAPYTRSDDPYSGFNHAMFNFNQVVDKFVFKPLAVGYKFIVPSPVRKSVINFFNNLNDVNTLANDVLQAKGGQAVSDTWRIFFNSTLGIGGLFDVATPMGLTHHNEDLGLTFARWGVKDSPYLVLPIFGPSTLRDGVALPINLYYLTVYSYITDIPLRNSLYGLNAISQRAIILNFEKLEAEAALDKYEFEKDAYLQYRKAAMEQKIDTTPWGANVTTVAPHP